MACCGRDVNVRAAITTAGGSVSLSAGRDVTLFAGSAMTTTNGNIQLCAGHDVIVNSKITLTNSGSIPSQGLDLPLGLTLIAGTNATAPGVAGGTVVFDPLFPATVTRSAAPVTDVTIIYNPASYAAATDFSLNLIRTGAVTLTQQMLVFPGGADKTFDGNTLATFTSLQGSPAGVTLVAGTANFDTAAVGTGKTITYSGFSLAGANAGNFALPVACCGPAARTTTGSIIAAPPVVPPVVVIPPVSPPVVPPVVPPIVPPVVVVPPVETPPVETAPVALALETSPEAPQLEFAPETMPVQDRLNLAVIGTGVRMPPPLFAYLPPVPPAPVIVPPVAPPVVVPPAPPPPMYVPPVLPPKPDRG